MNEISNKPGETYEIDSNWTHTYGHWVNKRTGATIVCVQDGTLNKTILDQICVKPVTLPIEISSK